MVQVVPPLDPESTPAMLAIGAGLPEDTRAVDSAGETPIVHFADRIDEIAAKAAALVSDPPMRPGPPPLLAAVVPASSQAAASVPGLRMASWPAITGGLVAAALVATSAWWCFSGDPPDDGRPSVVAQAAAPAEPKPTTEQADSRDEKGDPVTSPSETAASSSDAHAAGVPPEAEPLEGALDNANNAPPPVGEATAVVSDPPGGVKSNERVQASGSAKAKDAENGGGLTANQAGAAVEPAPAVPDAQVVRKPSLVLEDLPEALLQTMDPAAVLSTNGAVPNVSQGATTASAQAAEDSANSAAPVVAEQPPGARLPLRRIPPGKVDVPARLAIAIAGVQFREASLHEVVRTIGDLAGVTVSVDIDALYAAGVGIAEPVNVAGTSQTIGTILEQALGPIGLTARESAGQLVIGPKNAAQVRQARYAVDDLVRSGDPPIDELVDMVRMVVGHHGAVSAEKLQLRVADGAILLSASEIAHDRMIELCEKLRVARGRPLRSRYNPERPDPRFDPRRFELATRRAKAQSVLGRSITAGIGRAAPLRDVVDFLAAQSGASILLDARALAEAGLAVETESRLVANGEPLAMVLDRLLEPLELAYRVVDESVLEITSLPATAERPCIEFYRVSGLPAGAAAAAEALESYRDKVVAAAGLDNADLVVVFDVPSQCLIVSAGYPQQVRIERAVQKLDRP
jgi:hypothetical protein